MTGPVPPNPPALPVTWRPRRNRAVLLAASALLAAVFVGMALVLPPSWQLNDRIMLLCLGAVFSGVGLMLARPRVVADPEGVLVVNLVRSRRLHWAEIVRVNLRQGDPWVTLDLADGTSLAAMGIQPSGGRDQAVRAALQLRDLADERGATSEPATA
ncbi:PH domain-containing protein [Kitasatospora viridis]|uniref:PH (Pleckstrin Homology) domain-containing protein n=1 Tax=Kitasatospora viridis TaxID=281105 RepID=A0A561SF88_9ACTN|nr:PH domain-containing protein [Kitasatospora viridis]TWF73478.1 PH (Pleckstrin Homology) domain-containing protein [Kitasatospora viridis]